MNPILARFMLSNTPDSIINPAPTLTTPLQLNTDATIPAIGIATGPGNPGEVKQAVLHALRSGYRHIDCAFYDQNEDEVGEALREAFAEGIKREDLFITSKLWCTYHARVETNLDMSLRSLGLEYLDLYLMHWPISMNLNGNHSLCPRLPDGTADLDTEQSHVRTWQEMERLPTTGKTKAIGVANYSKSYLEELLKHAEIVPAVNQIESHPYLPQQEVVDFCHSKSIHVTAHSPFGGTDSSMAQEEGLRQIAMKHEVAPGTILLSYHLARGLSVLPRSLRPGRIEENKKLVRLEDDEVEQLDSIQKAMGVKRYVVPPYGLTLGFPDMEAGQT